MDFEIAENDSCQRCARKLPLNAESQLNVLGSTLQLIIQNCLSNSSDPKYFKIKVSGTTFKSKIAAYEGGVEFLLAVGFISDIIENEKYLRLPEFDKEHLETSIAWLLNSISTCLEMKQTYSNNKTDTPCADCIIQIRLPNNTTTTAGFLRFETIRSVQSFSSCYFQSGR